MTVRRLVFAGEAIVDVIMRVPALPDRGGDVLASSAEVTAGGPAGCVLAQRGQEILRIPAPTVEAIDTTGAGDTHAGVFIAALAEGRPAAQAAARANAAAAYSVTRPGPATAPSRAALDAWLTRHP